MYKLLIADDEKQIRDGLAELLDWEQYGIDECLLASNGVEALEIAVEKKPSILITDIQMPNMNGLELLEKIRESVPECRSIVLSGFDDYHYVRKAMKNGAMDYLLKPVSRADIIQIIDEVTDNIEEHRKASRENLFFQRSVTISRFLRQEISPADFREKMNVLGFNLPQGECAVGILVPPDTAESDVSPDWILPEEVEKRFSSDKCIMSFVDPGERVGFLFFHADGVEDDFLESSVYSVREFLESEYALVPELVLGSQCRSYRTAAFSYESAVKEMERLNDKDTSMERRDLLSENISFSKRVNDMIYRAENDYSNPDLSLQVLADEYQANSAYIGRMFKKETGVSFNDYLKRIRVRKAEELLSSGKIKGVQISEMVGFSNYNYFYYVFKQETGMNPMEFQHKAAK